MPHRMPDEELEHQTTTLIQRGMEFDKRLKDLLKDPLVVAALAYDEELAEEVNERIKQWEGIRKYLTGPKPAIVDVWFAGDLWSDKDPIHETHSEMDDLNDYFVGVGDSIQDAITDLAQELSTEWDAAHESLNAGFQALDELTAWDPADYEDE